MRSGPAVVVATLVLLTASAVAEAAPRRFVAGGRRERRMSSERARVEDAPASAFDCDTPRGARAYGSTARCLQALCSDANVVNAYVLDQSRRMRRNPCAGVDPRE